MKIEKVDITKLKTVRHYAELKGVVRETVTSWIKNKKIPYVQIDGVYFIIMEDEKWKEKT